MALLGPGETEILTENTKTAGGKSGKLILTSQRLIFEAEKEQGTLAKAMHGARYVTLMDSQLSQISNVHLDKPLLGRPALRVEGPKSITFRVRDPEAWSASIAKARQSFSPRYGGPAPAGQPVIVQVNQAPPAPPAEATKTIERQVVKIRCRYCGNLGDEIAGKCSKCGAGL